MAFYEIPLSPQPQRMSLDIGDETYDLRFHYANVPEGGWLLDIADAAGNSLVAGVSLVTGADLLAQYPELGIGARLFVTTDGDPSATPTFANLGVTSHVYLEVA